MLRAAALTLVLWSSAAAQTCRGPPPLPDTGVAPDSPSSPPPRSRPLPPPPDAEPVTTSRWGAEPAAAPLVSLSDADFERRTQAATGQTAGVWLVRVCAGCGALDAEWSALASSLASAGEAVAAALDSAGSGAATAERFAPLLPSDGAPAALLFRGGGVFVLAGEAVADAAAVRRWARDAGRGDLGAPLAVPPVPGLLQALRAAAAGPGAALAACLAVGCGLAVWVLGTLLSGGGGGRQQGGAAAAGAQPAARQQPAAGSAAVPAAPAAAAHK